jgi:DNA-binding MarR family transcriptional regulator
MRTRKAEVLTHAILSVFRVNGQLLNAGDGLVRHLGLTSARWQMLGAVALSGVALTAPRLAAAMGVTRQGAQKQLNALVAEGLMEEAPNPRHKRSPLYTLTKRGRTVYAAADKIQREWAHELAASIASRDLEAACSVLDALSELLDISKEGKGS